MRGARSSRGSRRALIAGPSKPAATSCDLLLGSTPGREEGGTSRSESSTRCRACSSIRTSCIASSASRPSVAAGDVYRDRRSRARVAAVVLSLEQHPGRRAARGRGGGAASRAERARRAGRAHARRRRRRSARRELRGPVAEAARARRGAVRRIPTSTRICARRFAARPSCCSPRCCASGRSVLELLDADYTYLERTARRALRHRRRARHVHAPRRAACRQPATRAARPRQHPHGDVGAEPHVARRPRPVDRGERLGRRVPTPPPGVEADLAKEASEAEGSRATPCASGSRCTARIPPAPPVTRSWIRSAWRSRTSTSWAAGASRRTAIRSTRRPSSPTARGSPGPPICAARCCRARTRSSTSLTERLLDVRPGARA